MLETIFYIHLAGIVISSLTIILLLYLISKQNKKNKILTKSAVNS